MYIDCTAYMNIGPVEGCSTVTVIHLGIRTLEFESQTEVNQNNKHYDSIISISTRKTSITAPDITVSHTLVDITNN